MTIRRLRALPATRAMAALAAVAILSGCLSVPLPTMVKLARWNPTQSDPAGIRAAIRIPDGLDLAPDSPALILSAWNDGAERIEDRMVLAETSDPSEILPLMRWRKPGFVIRAYRIAPADLTRIGDFRRRAEAKQLKRGSVEISAEGCRHGDFAGAVLLTTFLKTDARSDYVMLTRESDLAKLAGMAKAKGLPPLPECPAS